MIALHESSFGILRDLGPQAPSSLAAARQRTVSVESLSETLVHAKARISDEEYAGHPRDAGCSGVLQSVVLSKECLLSFFFPSSCSVAKF